MSPTPKWHVPFSPPQEAGMRRHDCMHLRMMYSSKSYFFVLLPKNTLADDGSKPGEIRSASC